MGIKEAVLWALLGGSAAEMTLALSAIRPSSTNKKWVWPWTKAEMPVYGVWMIVRLFVSGALAAPLADAQRISDGFTAFVLGIAAPLLLTKIATMAQGIVGRSTGDVLSSQDAGTQSEQFTSQGESGVIPGARTPEEIPPSNTDATGVDSANQ